MGILKSTREFKTPGAVKEHTNEVRGGGRDPGVITGSFHFSVPYEQDFSENTPI